MLSITGLLRARRRHMTRQLATDRNDPCNGSSLVLDELVKRGGEGRVGRIQRRAQLGDLRAHGLQLSRSALDQPPPSARVLVSRDDLQRRLRVGRGWHDSSH
jgi:hypothetical protein